MPSPKSTTAHTVKHTPSAYLVRDAAGATVARYAFDGDDFHGSRRVAYRAALAHAAELDAQAEQAEVRTAIAAGGELAALEAETPCTWCGGDRCKSVMQPAFCIDCVDAMLKDQGETRRDLHRQPAPFASADDEALARHLVGELAEYDVLNLPCDARYDAKSAQVRALGFEIGPDGQGALCVWRADNSGPLHPAPSIPDDSQAEECPDCDRSFWRSEMSGRCYDVLGGHEIFTCPCGCDITSHLGGPDEAPPAVPAPGDDPEPTPPAPASVRVLWRWGGSARVLRAVIAERQRLVAA